MVEEFEMIVVDYKDNAVSLRGVTFYKYSSNAQGATVSSYFGTTEEDEKIFWQNAISKRMIEDNFFGWIHSLKTIHNQSALVAEWVGDEYFLNKVCVGKVDFVSNGPIIPHGTKAPITYSPSDDVFIYHGHVDGLLDLIYMSRAEAMAGVETVIADWLRQVTNDMIHHTSTLMSPEWFDFKYRVLPEISKQIMRNKDGTTTTIKIAKFSSPEDVDPNATPATSELTKEVNISDLLEMSRRAVHGNGFNPREMRGAKIDIDTTIDPNPHPVGKGTIELNTTPIAPPTPNDHGYHVKSIAKGELGEASKLAEELEEFLDAIEQGSSVMALVELGDLVGAIEAYLEKHHPTIKIDDLKIFSDITKRAFKNKFR